jgi:hypothetical protein
VAESPGGDVESLFEGKMIWQFVHDYAPPKFWVNRKRLRKYLFGNQTGLIDADCYRIVLRRQSASTNERTLITTIIPRAFHADNLAAVRVLDDHGRHLITDAEQVFLCAILNSFCLDFVVRQRVTNNLNFFYLYQLPTPRLRDKDPQFRAIVNQTARLICTTPEFDDLAREVGLKGHKQGVTDAVQRAVLRAELDGLIAHLYGLTETEFAHVLSTFPLVPDPVKIAAHNAYRDVERGLIR